jgi:hypothetical protein
MAMEGIGTFAQIGTDFLLKLFQRKEKRNQLKKLLISEFQKNVELANITVKVVDANMVVEVNKRPKLAILSFRTNIGDFCIKNGLIFIFDWKDETIEMFLDVYDTLHDYNEIISYHKENFEIVASPLEGPENARHGTYVPLLLRERMLTQLIPKISTLKETLDITK